MRKRYRGIGGGNGADERGLEGEWKGMERNRRGCGLEGVIEGNKRE